MVTVYLIPLAHVANLFSGRRVNGVECFAAFAVHKLAIDEQLKMKSETQ